MLPALILASSLQHGVVVAQDETTVSDPEAASSRRKVATMEELAQVLEKEKAAAGKTVQEAVKLPPLPEGVTELRFDEFYKMPVGPRGLEPTEKLRSLHGKRVRILGYMANMQLRGNRQMLLAPVPLKAQPLEYGQADDIPATHVLVRVPGNAAVPVPYTPGLLLFTGRLTVGGRSLDGENAFVRLLLDAPEIAPSTSTASPTPAPTSTPAASQPPQ